jgi:hypothetical protein
VNPPFIFGPALRGDAADDDLALAQREMTLVEQAAAAEPLEQARIAGERREQDERRSAWRHDVVQKRLQIGRKRRIERGEAC